MCGAEPQLALHLLQRLHRKGRMRSFLKLHGIAVLSAQRNHLCIAWLQILSDHIWPAYLWFNSKIGSKALAQICMYHMHMQNITLLHSQPFHHGRFWDAPMEGASWADSRHCAAHFELPGTSTSWCGVCGMLCWRRGSFSCSMGSWSERKLSWLEIFQPYGFLHSAWIRVPWLQLYYALHLCRQRT